jgi:GT2 family glycosyltransferase
MKSSKQIIKGTNSDLPMVGIVVVNWNKKRDLLRLLENLGRLDYPHYHVVVVDNASTDGSSDLVRTSHPSVTLLLNAINLGGTGGFSTGIDYCMARDFDYIWLLDNDALVEPDALSNLVAAASADSSTGVVGSKILNSEDPSFIVKLGARIDWREGLVRSVMQNVKNTSIEKDIIEVDYVPFCSALISRKCLIETGSLDNRFFIYWDDSDFCIRSGKKGFKTIVAINSIVYHPSFTEKSRDQNYYLVRNALLFFSKHLEGKVFVTTLSRVVGRFIKESVFASLTRDTRRSRVIRNGVQDFLLGRFGRMGADIQGGEKSGDSENVPWHAVADGRILITYEGTADVMRGLVTKAFEYGAKSVTVLTPHSRSELFNGMKCDILVLDDRNSNLFLEHLKTFFVILKHNFDFVIISYATSPFSFAVKKSFAYEVNSDSLRVVPHSIKNSPLLLISLLLSYLLLIGTLPLICWRGAIERHSNPTTENCLQTEELA